MSKICEIDVWQLKSEVHSLLRVEVAATGADKQKIIIFYACFTSFLGYFSYNFRTFKMK